MNTMDYKLLDSLRGIHLTRPPRSESERDSLVHALRMIWQEAKRYEADEARAETEIMLKGRYRTAYAEYLKRERTRRWVRRRCGRHMRQLAS